jgi:hypothetical protein
VAVGGDAVDVAPDNRAVVGGDVEPYEKKRSA